MIRAWAKERRRRFVMWVLQVSRRAHVWAIMQDIKDQRPEQILQIKEFVITTVFHVKSDVAQWLSHTKTEADIITARLARKNDPGMALNEAYQRTQKAVDAGLVDDHRLLPTQKAALAFQEQFLRKNAQTPKRPLGT